MSDKISIYTVKGGQLTWSDGGTGNYSFSLQNRLQKNVQKVFCLVIFYDVLGKPVDVDLIHYDGLIPVGLAKRVRSHVYESVRDLVTGKRSSGDVISSQELTKNDLDAMINFGSSIKYRILDFEIVN